MWLIQSCGSRKLPGCQSAQPWILTGLILLVWIGVSRADSPPDFTPEQLEAAAQRALGAILCLQDQNTGLLDSYSDDADEHPDQAGKLGFLFDQAVALIVFSHAGQTDSQAANAAEDLAEALIRLQHSTEVCPTGYWYWAYETTVPYRVGIPTVPTGPNAWVAYALLYYASTLDRAYRADARTCAAAFADYAIDNLRGSNRYDYQWGKDEPWHSTEINVDMWWLFSSLGHQFVHSYAGQPRNGKWWAGRLYEELTARYWNGAQERWNRGSVEDYNNDWISEDAQTWGFITSLFAGDVSKQQDPLTFAQGNLQQLGFLHGTYYHGDLELDGMEDNVNPLVPGPCFQTIWNEGSGHLVTALQYADRGSEATAVLNSLVASEDRLPAPVTEECNAGVLRGWAHSLDTVLDNCDGNHYGPDYGIHVGASAWLYFAVKSRHDDMLPYRSLAGAEVPAVSFLWPALVGVLALVGLWSLRKLRRQWP